MLKFEYTVQGRLGWCARACSIIVQSIIYTKSVCTCRIISRPHDDVPESIRVIDMKSIMNLLMGAASKGTVVEVSIEGPDEVEVAGAAKYAIAQAEKI